MAGVLRVERMWAETFTGLRMTQFSGLLKAVRERDGNGALRGRPWSLPLDGRVPMVAVHYRTNLSMRQLGPLFGVSSSRACRVIQRLGPLLALEPASCTAETANRLCIVDGTLVPVRDRNVGSSSRNYRFSANVQVVVDADTRLAIAAARPLPGPTADAHAWRASGLSDHCQDVTVLGDGAYLNRGMAVPHRKRPHHPLLPDEEEDNAAHRKVRARVEHVIGRMKNYKILHDCRQRGDGLHHAVQAVAHIHNLALAS
ncbi:transposase family protein [Streptomyces sp. WELS2]|uniref:transposase family protein n=1 Tax=Streptomyces sp. WELS2 TaxID=2749435 RepID=UPI0015F0AB95|nr:transposase family protein [Streptomyces sp. WELS2]